MNLRKYSREIRIGVVFIIAAAILIWGLMYLKGVDIFNKKRTLYALYNHVNGMEPTSPVFIKGLKVGQVQKIYFSKEIPGKVIARLYINDMIPIPVNSTARIQSSDLLGSKQIEIILGDSEVMVKDSDTLNATIEATLTEEVNRQLLPLKKKAESLISSIDTVATIVQQVLNKNTQENLIRAFENIKIAVDNITHTTYHLDTLVGTQRRSIAGIISNVESISKNLRNNNDEINRILANLAGLSDSLAKARIPATIRNVNQAVTNLNTALEKVNRGEGSLGLLVNDRKLYNDLDSAAKSLNAIILDIKANPRKYLKISVF